MFKYLNRLYSRYTGPINAAVALATFYTIFRKPIHLFLCESQSEDYINKNPRQAHLREEFEERKATIIQLVKDIKSTEDPEEKKNLEKKLKEIHLQRFQRFQAIAHSPLPPSDTR